MSTKAVNMKLDENRIRDVKKVAAVFRKTITDVVNEALDEYLSRMKEDPFYRLTANVEDASKEETEEILKEIDQLSDDDLRIVTVRQFRA